jgi:hypothetical protein
VCKDHRIIAPAFKVELRVAGWPQGSLPLVATLAKNLSDHTEAG